MDEADLELVRDWLTRAHQDLRGAVILAAAEDAPLDLAIYDFVLNRLPAEAHP